MIGEHYPTISDYNNRVFKFKSIGPKGEIEKIIIFEPLLPLHKNEYNLALCIMKDGLMVDDMVTNNNDFYKTIYTVVKSIYIFFETYPEASLKIGAEEERRDRIYNGIFKRKHHEIIEKFDIFGYINGRIELYNLEKFYDHFELKRKKA